jgi:hypothetical protein
MHRPLRTLVRLVPLATFVGLAALGCSDGGGSSTATAPPPPGGGPGATTGASVSGKVSSGGRAASGVQITVEGTALSARTDSTGRFALERVPLGDQTLGFSTGRGRSPVEIRDLRDEDRIEMEVSISGSTARVTSMSRNGRPERTGGDGGPLAVQVSPDSWNTNWTRSSGQLTVFLRGEGFDRIDPESVVLVGDDLAALPLEPRRVSIQGNHLQAKFGQADAFDLLLEPNRGTTHTILVQFELDGTAAELEATVRVVGPAI